MTSASANVAKSARALADTFVATVADDEGATVSTAGIAEQVSDETFRKFVAALSGPRDLKRGHEMFSQACATCHRIGNEGFDVAPDLLGQLDMPEETLLQDLLAPNQRIRPGYETTQVRMRDGSVVLGLLKDDGATSLTLVQAGGVEQILLRKDVGEVRRLGTSLMPSFAEGLTPADAANVLAWLKAQFASTGSK
jgi:putative heme-binding domain-containing protein